MKIIVEETYAKGFKLPDGRENPDAYIAYDDNVGCEPGNIMGRGHDEISAVEDFVALYHDSYDDYVIDETDCDYPDLIEEVEDETIVKR